MVSYSVHIGYGEAGLEVMFHLHCLLLFYLSRDLFQKMLVLRCSSEANILCFSLKIQMDWEAVHGAYLHFPLKDRNFNHP